MAQGNRSAENTKKKDKSDKTRDLTANVHSRLWTLILYFPADTSFARAPNTEINFTLIGSSDNSIQLIYLPNKYHHPCLKGIRVWCDRTTADKDLYQLFITQSKHQGDKNPQ